MYDCVLVPTDGSEAAPAALDHALVAAEGASVHALSVVNQRLYLAATDEERDGVRASLEEESAAALDAVRERGSDRGVEVATERRDGVPHREILGYASEIGADLIVMASHGRTGRERVESLGSVTEQVVKGADVPVLTVPK